MKYAEVADNVGRLLDELPSQDEFIYELLLAYGSPKSGVTLLKKGTRNLSKVQGEVLWKNKVWFKSVETDLYDFIEKMKSAKAAKTNIVCGNATRIDWERICPQDQGQLEQAGRMLYVDEKVLRNIEQ